MTGATNKWVEYETRKRDLPSLPPAEYDREIRRICEELEI